MKKVASAQTAGARPPQARTTQRAGATDILPALSRGGLVGISVKDLTQPLRDLVRHPDAHDWFLPPGRVELVPGLQAQRLNGRRLTEIKRLFAALENLVSPEAIGPWLKEPNPAFDGSTPLQVIERGETDRIWRMVYELESGEPA
jgi:hypothetical protein